MKTKEEKLKMALLLYYSSDLNPVWDWEINYIKQVCFRDLSNIDELIACDNELENWFNEQVKMLGKREFRKKINIFKKIYKELEEKGQTCKVCNGAGYNWAYDPRMFISNRDLKIMCDDCNGLGIKGAYNHLREIEK